MLLGYEWSAVDPVEVIERKACLIEVVDDTSTVLGASWV